MSPSQIANSTISPSRINELEKWAVVIRSKRTTKAAPPNATTAASTTLRIMLMRRRRLPGLFSQRKVSLGGVRNKSNTENVNNNPAPPTAHQIKISELLSRRQSRIRSFISCSWSSWSRIKGAPTPHPSTLAKATSPISSRIPIPRIWASWISRIFSLVSAQHIRTISKWAPKSTAPASGTWRHIFAQISQILRKLKLPIPVVSTRGARRQFRSRFQQTQAAKSKWVIN